MISPSPGTSRTAAARPAPACASARSPTSSVTRTTVTKALKLTESAGLIEFYKRMGWYVKEPRAPGQCGLRRFQQRFSAVSATRGRLCRRRNGPSPTCASREETMRLSRKLVGLLAGGMMAVGLTAAAAPARASSPYFHIRTFYGVSALDECVQGDFGGPLGTTVTQHYCDPTFTQTDQLWLPISTGGKGFKFENLATGMCLEARFGAVNAQPVALWFCDSTESNTHWEWDNIGGPGSLNFPDQGVIQSRVSGSTGYCLDVPGASTAIGLSLQLYHCNGTYAQGYLINQPG
jgi:hypothetical protein